MGTEFVHFKISARQISNVFGLFSCHQQYNSMCDILKQSPHRNFFFDHTFKQSVQYKDQNDYLEKAGVRKKWYDLLNTECKTIEQIAETLSIMRLLLFDNKHIHDHLTTCPDEIVCAFEVARRAPENVTLPAAFTHTFPAQAALLDTCVKLYAYAKRRLCKAHGVYGEQAYIAEYNNLVHPEQKIVKKDDLFKQSGSTPTQGYSWGITGKIDGLSNGQIIEIKHRASGKFQPISTAELVQIHTYMYLLDKTEAKLVQCIRKTQGVYTDTSIVFFSHEFWQRVMKHLSQFFFFLEQMVSSEIAWECFVRCGDEEKRNIVTKYVGVFSCD